MGNLLKIVSGNRFLHVPTRETKKRTDVFAIVVEFVCNFTYDNLIQQIYYFSFVKVITFPSNNYNSICIDLIKLQQHCIAKQHQLGYRIKVVKVSNIRPCMKRNGT